MTKNKYTPRDTEFVVIWKHNGKVCPTPFASRFEAHQYACGLPHTVKPIGSLAAQAATGATP